MEDIKRRLIHIHSCRGVGWKKIYQFLKYDSTLQTIFSLKIKDFQDLFKMSEKNSKIFHNHLHSSSTEQIIHSYEHANIIPLTIFDNDYPADLRHTYDPPWVLYLKGKKSLLKGNCISVVGTRFPSPYGYQATGRIIPPLIENNWTVVSGLALGIDTEAHRIAINNKGKTIAVLGSGFNHIYPVQNHSLATEISNNHLLITEYPPPFKAEKWHFPLRNRIISGLSKGLVVIEAKARSGSLITADQALEQGREVFAVPGSIFEANHEGTNHLIQQGAKLIVKAEDIIDELSFFV